MIDLVNTVSIKTGAVKKLNENSLEMGLIVTGIWVLSNENLRNRWRKKRGFIRMVGIAAYLPVFALPLITLPPTPGQGLIGLSQSPLFHIRLPTAGSGMSRKSKFFLSEQTSGISLLVGRQRHCLLLGLAGVWLLM